MRIALLTANIGTLDEVYPPVSQTANYQLFYYTENTLPFPLPNLDNRMKGKYFKTQAHRFLDHDIFIWIDASIDIISANFIEDIINELRGYDLVSSLHMQRTNVYDELVYVIDKMKEGNKYLLRRYVKQPLYDEYSFYQNQGLPKDYPLYNCWFFARWNNIKVNEAFDIWWDTIMRYSNFDQTQFSYAAWKSGLAIKSVATDEYMIRNKHNGYNL